MYSSQKISNFDLQQIAESGQCFRMNKIDENYYSVISRDRYLEIRKDGDKFCFHCQEEDYQFWIRYFDLDTDYGVFLSSIGKNDRYLHEAAQAGSGIRILRQDPWEMIITFVISQQKTIPKIREAVEALSLSYGTGYRAVIPGLSGNQEVRTFHAFPEPGQLAVASLEDLQSLKLGYRAKYIWRICRDCVEGRLDLTRLLSLSYEDAMQYLTGFYGIGVKVANCICLYGLHHTEAFPIDTWIQQILMNHYYQEKYDELPKNRLLPAMVQDNFGRYRGYAGVMQQYIFFYERSVLSGRR